jgi:hypothetical protein
MKYCAVLLFFLTEHEMHPHLQKDIENVLVQAEGANIQLSPAASGQANFELETPTLSTDTICAWLEAAKGSDILALEKLFHLQSRMQV